MKIIIGLYISYPKKVSPHHHNIMQIIIIYDDDDDDFYDDDNNSNYDDNNNRITITITLFDNRICTIRWTTQIHS